MKTMFVRIAGTLASCLILLAALAACGAAAGPEGALPGGAEQHPGLESTAPAGAAGGAAPSGLPAGTAAPPEYVEITIAAAGDVLVHNTLYYGAWDAAAGQYDFRPQFRAVAPILAAADYAVVNLETTLAGAGVPYSGYPRFNSPDSLAAALKDAGVDAVTGANNHCLDTGRNGFFHTIETARANGLEIWGVRAAAAEPPFFLTEIKGLRLAFINFSYCGRGADGGKSFNGLPLPADMTDLVNGFAPAEGAEAAAAEIGAHVLQARKLGAQAIIVFLHWGNEYQRRPDEFQRRLARLLADQGVTAVIGGHPHVVQTAEILTGAEGERVPVFYSLGNFISDQRLETVDDIHTEQGLIAWLKLRGRPGERLEMAEAWYEPTWVMKKISSEGKYIYEIIPSEKALASPAAYPQLNAADWERISLGARQTAELMELTPPPETSP